MEDMVSFYQHATYAAGDIAGGASSASLFSNGAFWRCTRDSVEQAMQIPGGMVGPRLP